MRIHLIVQLHPIHIPEAGPSPATFHEYRLGVDGACSGLYHSYTFTQLSLFTDCSPLRAGSALLLPPASAIMPDTQ